MTEISTKIPMTEPFPQVAVVGGQQKIRANSQRAADSSETAEKCSEMTQNESTAFAPVSRCVPSEKGQRVRIPVEGLERLYGGVCEK
jgi:hypothetical protein